MLTELQLADDVVVQSSPLVAERLLLPDATVFALPAHTQPAFGGVIR